MASQEGTKPTLDLRPADLVSRLLAATPPYLYAMPLTNSFFFSEMLRSFVQARGAGGPGGAGATRRGRKRAWREARAPSGEAPLELTTSPRAEADRPKAADPPKEPPTLLPPPMLPGGGDGPPAAPLWFPPIGLCPPPPPHCFDPHYFVDLRVSGHIWDRKPDKEPASEPLDLHHRSEPGPALNLSFRRRDSAFSVPRPRRENGDGGGGGGGEAAGRSLRGASYVLPNLDKIYRGVRTKREADAEADADAGADTGRASVADDKGAEGGDDEELSPEEKRVRDLRALIGLELVVDYVKQERVPGDREEREDREGDGGLSDASDSNQEPLVMD